MVNFSSLNYHRFKGFKCAEDCKDLITLSCIMLKNGQTYFKNLWCKQHKIFKVCLAIF